jgi:phenylalanyl-tRNA synthetase alpha chain
LTVSWSDIQRERLRALGAVAATIEAQFEKELVTEQKRRLQELRDGARRTKLSLLESRLTGALVDNGFVQVATPIIMSKGHLARMSIDEGHPLSSQVFWLDDKTCLRPMLAPHLYYVLKDLLRLWEKPVRIFEVGSCFRKESSGARHSTEFTMLNLVEMGLELESRESRLKELAALIVEAADMSSKPRNRPFMVKRSMSWAEREGSNLDPPPWARTRWISPGALPNLGSESASDWSDC